MHSLISLLVEKLADDEFYYDVKVNTTDFPPNIRREIEKILECYQKDNSFECLMKIGRYRSARFRATTNSEKILVEYMLSLLSERTTDFKKESIWEALRIGFIPFFQRISPNDLKQMFQYHHLFRIIEIAEKHTNFLRYLVDHHFLSKQDLNTTPGDAPNFEIFLDVFGHLPPYYDEMNLEEKEKLIYFDLIKYYMLYESNKMSEFTRIFEKIQKILPPSESTLTIIFEYALTAKYRNPKMLPQLQYYYPDFKK